MIEFGNTLRAAREAKGLTASELAELTRMPLSRIEQLEHEDFSRIPAAIYGRGFVRLYCEAVGLDPKPLTDEFTEIYNGNREVEIRERPTPPRTDPLPLTEAPATTPIETAAEPLAATASTPAPEPELLAEPPPPRQYDLFSPPEPSVASPTSFSKTPEVPPSPSLPPETPAADSEPAAFAPRFSRYAAPLRERADFAVPAPIWRFGVIGLVAIALLIAAFFGIRALYRATSGSAPSTESSGTVTNVEAELPASDTPETKKSPSAAPNAVPPATSRTPQKIPALYID